MAQMPYIAAIDAGIHQEMRRDPKNYGYVEELNQSLTQWARQKGIEYYDFRAPESSGSNVQSCSSVASGELLAVASAVVLSS